jgi:hypothetical protein
MGEYMLVYMSACIYIGLAEKRKMEISHKKAQAFTHTKTKPQFGRVLTHPKRTLVMAPIVEQPL